MQMIAFAMETACTYEGRDVETGRERERERERTLVLMNETSLSHQRQMI
jgi:hypothetical protein